MMADIPGDLTPFEEKMRAEGLPDIVIQTFGHYYTQLVEGHTGLIPESDISPVTSLPDAEAFSAKLAEVGKRALPKTILLKLNGGLGTSMGLNRAKSLLQVKDRLSFLDIIARQALRSRIPLVLMNSFSTREDSLGALAAYPELAGELPLDFLQHKIPKVVQADYRPATWSAAPELEWCPPGHGDIYTALVTTGMLDRMLEAGFETIFVSNSDNLGAVIDTTLLGHFVSERLPFMMEVADRTLADRKGGHLAKLPSGQLMLRESAQCPKEDLDSFQDVTRHRYFNTNNLWIDLRALRALMTAKENILGLAMIRNAKTVDPRDAESTPVFQLETAMGSAIAVFEGAGAVRVPRSRFAPVKTTNDLLSIRSDDYLLDEEQRIVPHPDRSTDATVVMLDPAHYKLIDHMEARFPHGPPSLVKCTRLEVHGDVVFGEGVTLEGEVEIVNDTGAQVELTDVVLTGRHTCS